MKKLITRKGGFTLIELMIVVAIIGILAAIAIPNFLRFQLRARSAEGKSNLAAIRTAEEGYFSEFGTYVAAAINPASNGGTQKQPWGLAPTAVHGFNTLGWAPEGEVYFNYGVTATAGMTLALIDFLAEAQADLDEDMTLQTWGYVKPAPGLAAVAAAGPFAVCALNGVYNTVDPAMNILTTVGPCNAASGQSVF